MGFYVVLNTIDQLLADRRLWLHRCRRHGMNSLRYYVTDSNRQSLTETKSRRSGLTLGELLLWLEQGSDVELASSAQSMKNQIWDAA